MEEHNFTDSLKIANTSYNTSVHLQPERAFGFISYVLGTLITVINTASLFCLVRYRKHISGAGFSQQLIFLCLTDILSGIGISLFYFGSLFSYIDSLIYYSFCIAGLVIFPISITSSVGNCCMISVQRYIAMRNITRQINTWNNRRMIKMILFNILLCILTFLASAAVVSMRYGFHYEEFCDQIDRSGLNDYKSLFVPGTIIIAFMFLMCINVLTILSIYQLAKAKREHLSASRGFESCSNLSVQLQDFQYATRTFILIVIVLNITLIPSIIFIPISIKYDIDISTETVEILSRFASVNSLLNPFVYFLRMRNFRRAVWNDIRKVFHVN